MPTRPWFSIKVAIIVICASAVSAVAAENPLLKKQFRIPFDQIRAEHVQPAVQQLLADAQKRRETFVAGKSPRTWENTMAALEDMTEDLSWAMGVARYLEGVANTPALRGAMADVLPKVMAFSSSMGLDAGIYAKVKEYSETAEGKALTGPRKRLLEKSLKRYRRAGIDLPEEQKTRLKAMSVESAQLSKKFSDNVLDSTNAVDFVIEDEGNIAGLPASDRAAALQSAKQKGVEGWRFTLQAPSYVAVMTHIKDAALRERMYRAYNNKAISGAQDNRPLMKRILELRRERARLLGFQTYADLQTEERMAKSGENVRRFLSDLERKTRPFAEQEDKELLAFRRGIEGPQAPALQPWDIGYYAEKMRKARYDFEEEALRPYFPMPGVMKGMFEIVGRLYGIKIVKSSAPAWNPAVEYFEVRDSDGSLLGGFFADWFPREDKRAGAWSSAFIVGGPLGKVFEPHLGAVAGNMNPPVGDKPALLTHRDVETVFHEFGHQLHTILSRVPVRGLHNVAWDFVELPSQIMENFTWDRQCLDLFARHYQTGERIPDELFRKMLAARNFRAANAQMRQLSLGAMDLLLHTDYRGDADGDILAYTRKIAQRFTPATLPDEYGMVASFAHIFAGGYAAGYYSYKWAEVLDADAFTRFQKEGVISAKAGNDFRRKILEKGDTEDAAVLFRDFMGRDPDPDALLRRSGLIK